MITPTIGRVVLVHVGAAQPHAAFVTLVHSDRLINAAGFGAEGHPFAANSVTLLQDGDETPEGMYAEFAPHPADSAAPEDQPAGGGEDTEPPASPARKGAAARRR